MLYMGSHGVEGVKKAVSHILEGIPIHHYIMVDYEGSRKYYRFNWRSRGDGAF